MARKKRKKYKKQKDFKLNPKTVWIAAVVVILILILLGLGYLVYKAEAFKIKGYSIKSNVALKTSLKEKMRNQSLFDLDIKSISQQLLKENPEYKEVWVKKSFPNFVLVDVQKRKFYCQIKGRKFYPIDKEAIVLSNGEALPYKDIIPVEIGSQKIFKKGDKVKDENLSYVFNLIEELAKANLAQSIQIELIGSSDIEAFYFLIKWQEKKEKPNYAPASIKVIIGYRDFKKRLELLKQLIEGELKEKLNLVKYIDLRHKKVYVGFMR